MTAVVPPTTSRYAGDSRPVADVPAIPFRRLTAVELRKQVDTRAGRWLLVSIVAVNVILAVLVLLTSPPELLTWRALTETTTIGQLLLLPLIGILAATSEWTQRTALTTFTLEPRRTRVNLAKLTGAVALGAVTLVLTLAAAAALNGLGALLRGGDGSWQMDWAMLGGLSLALLVLVTQGVAFGLLFLSTPIAIVSYLLIPTAWTAVVMLVSALDGVAPWLDLSIGLEALMAGEMTPQTWLHLASSTAVWVALPLVLGLVRTARREVA